MDVLYDNQVCKLVYLRDITELLLEGRSGATAIGGVNRTSAVNDFLDDP